MTQTAHSGFDHDRRTVLRAVAATGAVGLTGTTLSACGAETGSSSDGSQDTPAPAGTELGKSSEVTVGGARIYSDHNVVVSQPSQGEFKAFSAVCTHQGCVVGEISGDKAVCPCHNSQFSITDGSVVEGPASEPLPEQAVSVEGDTLVLG